MTILRRLTEGIRDFVSPLRRRQQRERRLQDFAVPFAPQTPPNHQPRPRHGKTVSPTSRIAKWQEDAGTATAWADDTDDERRQDADLASQWNSNLNANGDVQVARPEDIDPDAGLIQNVSAQERQCMAKAAQLRQSGWEEHPIWLHYKISMRGFEPILPHHWLMDLETIPLSLFAEKVEDAFIRADYGSDFRAIRAIYALINLGTWVRDGLILGTRTEPALYRGIRVYHRWALHDGDLPERDTIPTMIFNVSPLTRPSADIQRRLLKRFNALHNRWKVRLILHQSHQDVMKTERVGLGITTGDESRLSPGLPGLPGPPAPSADAMPAVLQQPPTLYGVIVTGTVAAVVAYEPDIDRPCLRIVSIFDFRDDGYDVWNGFAIAFALIHARNQLLDYRAAGLDIGRKQQHPHLPEQTGAPE